MAVSIDDARAIVAPLPRSYEALVRDRVKFRVGSIVYAAFSRDDTIMGFAFPREEREALVASEPDKFLMPDPRTCGTNGCASVSTPSTSMNCVSSWSTRGACASRRRWPRPSRVDRHRPTGRLVRAPVAGVSATAPARRVGRRA